MANLFKRWNKFGKVAVIEAMMITQMEIAGYTFKECPIDTEEKEIVDVDEKIKDVKKTTRNTRKTKAKKESDAKTIKAKKDAQLKAEEEARINSAKESKNEAMAAGPDIVL